MRANYSVLIDAPRDLVFQNIVEPRSVLVWLSGLSEFEIIEDSELKVGTTFRQVWEDDGEQVIMNGTITKFKLDREYAVHLESESIKVDVHYVLDDHEEKTLVLQETAVRYSGIMKVVDFVAKRFMKASYLKEQAKNFNRLSALCNIEVPQKH